MTRAIFQYGLLLCLVLTAVFSGVPTAVAQEGIEGPKSPPSPEVAKPIYQERCANCHGATGRGDGPQAVQANLPMPDLTNAEILRGTTPARWFDIISDGVDGKAMPPFGDGSSNPLRQIDRWNLVFFLYSLGTPPTQVAMGQALYERSCAQCHGTDGTGGDEAPDLTNPTSNVTRSQTDLYAAIQKHDMGLGDVELWALADLVRTFIYSYIPPNEVAAPADAKGSAVIEPFVGGAGVVAGQVINGTAGGAPPEGEVIQLRSFDMNANFVDAITTTLAADGSFRFDGIDPAVPAQYEPLVVYRDIPYFGDLGTAITLTQEQPEANVNLTVYETTDDDGDIRIDRLHIVFDLAPGQMQVAELYILSNDGDRAYVGTVERGTLPITAPENALSFQPGGDPSRYLTLADGIADTVPIPPGQSTAESVVVYDMAYTDELDLSRPLPYDVSSVNVFVPADAGIEVSGDQIQPAGPFQAQGTLLDTYLADDLPTGERLTLRLSGAPQTSASSLSPQPNQPSGPSETQGILIGATALAGAVILAYMYWQGHLGLRLQPATQDRQSDLLQAIAELDDEYEAGGVKESAYRKKRARLKEELIALMEREN